MSVQELRKALKTEKISFGANASIKRVKNGTAKIVMLAKNCSEKIANDMAYYQALGKVKIEKLEQTSEEVALFCKKNHPVSVISY